MRYTRKYIILTLILGGLAIMESKDYARNYEGVEKFRGAELRAEIWNPLIAQSVNEKLISVNIDNKVFTNKNYGIYMDQQLNLMLPTNILRDSYDCSSHLYDNSQLKIQKYNDTIQMGLEQAPIQINGVDQEEQSSLVQREEAFYVSMESVSKNLGYDYTWNSKENTASSMNQTEAASNLPTKYDLRQEGRAPQVKDQGQFGTCWAFAALTALESSMLPEETYTLSPDHMSMQNSFQSGQNDGGEYTMGMAYLSAWQGPVLEQDDPYGDGVSTDGLQPVKHVQEVQILAEKDYNEIKEAVFKYGGVQASIYSALQNVNSISEYYSNANKAYCYMGAEKPNHDIVIVGWDDTYPKENFTMSPEGDGAFLCQNSWGNAFGEDGYFYVSYYDTNIGIHNVAYTKVEDTTNYDQIYQSDLCGWVGQIGYNKESIYGANVYTASEAQTIEAAGFYATGVNTDYELFVVNQFIDKNSLQEGTKVAEGNLKNAGYYTIPFDQAIPVEAGERFAIVLKITTPGAVHPLAIEYRADESTATVELTDGEGYISQTGGSDWENVEETQSCNLCLKAYAKGK